MANVSQRRPDSGMDNFFKGISALQQGAESLVRYNMLNKRLEQEKKMADEGLVLRTFKAGTERMQAENYGIQVESQLGTSAPTEKRLIKLGRKPETWKPFTSEERKTIRDTKRIEAQHKAKLTELDVASQQKIVLQKLKDWGADERQIKDLSVKIAANRITPAKVEVAHAATAILKKEVIQPFEELYDISNFFKKEKVTALTLIEKFGDEKTREMLPYIKVANERLKDSPSQRKKIFEGLFGKFPELIEKFPKLKELMK